MDSVNKLLKMRGVSVKRVSTGCGLVGVPMTNVTSLALVADVYFYFLTSFYRSSILFSFLVGETES